MDSGKRKKEKSPSHRRSEKPTIRGLGNRGSAGPRLLKVAQIRSQPSSALLTIASPASMGGRVILSNGKNAPAATGSPTVLYLDDEAGAEVWNSGEENETGLYG